MWIVASALVLGIGGVLAFGYVREDFSRWLERNADSWIENPEILLVGALILVSPILALAAYLFQYGRRIGQARRVPPPGYAVVVDTKVLEGAPAVRRARLIVTIAAILFCAASALPLLLWQVFRSLRGVH